MRDAPPTRKPSISGCAMCQKAPLLQSHKSSTKFFYLHGERGAVGGGDAAAVDDAGECGGVGRHVAGQPAADVGMYFLRLLYGGMGVRGEKALILDGKRL